MTKDSFVDIVGELRQVSDQLNQATDDAAKMVAEVETFLNTECSIGVPASVEFAQERPDETTMIKRYLAYARVSGKFRIAITSAAFFVNEDGDDVRQELEPVAWPSAPREYKLASVAVMLELLKAIIENATSKVEKASDAVDAVSDVLLALYIDK
jgi:hypothetical protein